MASIEKNIVSRTVYNLELSYEEAEVLVNILSRVGGRGKFRTLSDSVLNAIAEHVPYEYNGVVGNSLVGNLILQDEE